jgi:organic radical activating enzyme
MKLKDKIRAFIFFHTLREVKKKGGMLSRGARCTLVTTIKCPFRCSYCPMFIYGEPRKQDECTAEEWEVFLDRFPMWISAMYISGGEPSLYKDIVPLINNLIKRGYHVLLQTNLYKAEAYIGIKPHKRLVFMATYHEEQEQNRGDSFYRSADMLRKEGFLVITQQIGQYNKKHSRIKEFFTEKWFKETDNSIMLEPSAPRTLRMWLGCVNMYDNDLGTNCSVRV